MYSEHIKWGRIMPANPARERPARGETINLRATHRQKDLIDRAAEALGRSRSDFMLDAACRQAEEVLLDRRYFVLSKDDFNRFMKLLDARPSSNPKLRRLLQTSAPWEK